MQALCQWDVQHDESNDSLESLLNARDTSSRARRYAETLVRAFWARRADVNTMIEPLSGTGPPRFKPLKYADFLTHELEAAYQAHKPRNSPGFPP